MKLNEVSRPDKLSEALSDWIGDYATAALTPGGMSNKDKMAQNIFSRDFVGRATSAINSAIKGNLVDPNSRSQLVGPVNPPAPGAAKGTSATTPKPSPGAAAFGQMGKQLGGGSTAPPVNPGAAAFGQMGKQLGGAPTTASGSSVAPQTPAEIRAQKQAAATAVVRGNMATTSAAVPKPPATPAEIRAQKQAAAGAAARGNMAATSIGPPKAAAAPAAPAASKSYAQAFPKANAAAMGTPSIPKPMTTPAASKSYAQTFPKASAAAAADDEADAAVAAHKNSRPAVQSNAIHRKPERAGLVNPRRNFRESTYNQLNRVFEGMLNEEAESISSYLQRWVKQYLKGINLSDPRIYAEVNKMINNVQTTWANDKGKAALTTLANTAYALSHSNKIGGGASTPPAAAPQSAGQAFMKGMKSAATTPSATTATQPTASGLSQLSQLLPLVDKLDPGSKKQLINHLQHPTAFVNPTQKSRNPVTKQAAVTAESSRRITPK
jgi:hypothetical protein